MPKPLTQSVAVSILCLVAAASPALAQDHAVHKRHHRTLVRSYDNYGSTMPYASMSAAAPIVGTYKSSDFFPSPLVLTVTGVDAQGNITGTMSGMHTTPSADNVAPDWQSWNRTMPSEKTRGVYRNGQVTIQFADGGGYDLKLEGNQLTGSYKSGNSNERVSFLKSGPNGIAALEQ